MNRPVNFSTAKLLKEKGFDLPQLYFYIDGEISWKIDNTRCRNKIEGEYSAPTIADVIMWLYEKHGIWISPQPFIKLNKSVIWVYDIFKNNYIIEQLQPSKGVDSPTEVYEAAIEYTLKNLI